MANGLGTSVDSPFSYCPSLRTLYLPVMTLQSQYAQAGQVWWDLQFYYSQLQLLDLHNLQNVASQI